MWKNKKKKIGYSETESSRSSLRVSGDICLTSMQWKCGGKRLSSRSRERHPEDLSTGILVRAIVFNFCSEMGRLLAFWMTAKTSRFVQDIELARGVVTFSLCHEHLIIRHLQKLFSAKTESSDTQTHVNGPLRYQKIRFIAVKVHFGRFAVEEGGFHVHLEDDHVLTGCL
ncbi:hypothetical protein Tco_0087939 [Tanacetum coccineum]